MSNDLSGQAILNAHKKVDGHPNINPVKEVLIGQTMTYIMFPPSRLDLHSYVRTKRRLRESTARILFRQIVSAVHEAHSKGIVLRDLKLRKFVFADEFRWDLLFSYFVQNLLLSFHLSICISTYDPNQSHSQDQ